MNNCEITDLGLTRYLEARDLQKKIVQDRLDGKTSDTLLFCEHYPVITIGRKKSKKNLLVSEEFLREKGIEIYSVERGGEATFHCPGQIICYPIFELHNYGMDLHEFLRKIEKVIIDTLSKIGIEGHRREGYTGVWVRNGSGFEKIAFIGIACRKWVTYHGFSLNVDCDLTPFSWIIPCGLEGVKITSIKNICNGYSRGRLTVQNIEPEIIKNFEKEFNLKTRPVDLSWNLSRCLLD